MNELLPIAAIVHDGKHMTDGVLLDFVEDLRRQNWVLRGLVSGVMRKATNEASHCTLRTVRDLHTDKVYPISQNLGKGSVACCLDVGALMDAAGVLHRARQAQPDLVIVNRFGILEADGGGFVQEMLALMTDGIPMLTVVSKTYLDAWRTFTGGLAQELTPDKEAWHAWTKTLPAAQRLLQAA